MLFRVSGGDADEVRIWLTRRLVKQLWPNLVQLLSNKVAQEIPTANHDARRMVLGMQHEAAVGQADFSQPYRTRPMQFPLGESPFVAAKITMNVLPSALYLLALHPAEGRGVDLRLTEPLLHGWRRMLQKACREAEWDLALGFPGSPLTAAEGSAESRVLN